MARTAISIRVMSNKKSQVVSYEPPVLCGLLKLSHFSVASTMIGEIHCVIKMRMPPLSAASERNILDTASSMTYHGAACRAV
jgi:hypothetical protein